MPTIPKLMQAMIPRQHHSNGENMPDVSSLTAEVGRYTSSVSFWNRAVVVMMVIAALAATGLVVAQWIAIRQSESLATSTGKLTDFKEHAASERATQEENKRINLQNRMIDIFGPRGMSSAQSAEIAQKLLGLEDVQVDVLVVDLFDSPNSAEFKDSVGMGRSIQDTLKAANLDVEGWMANSCLEGAAVQGLNVAVQPDAKAEDEYFAGKILAAFPPALRFVNKVEHWEPAQLCKFSDLATTGKPNKRKPGTAKIMVIIGAKTQPILTREMLEPDSGPKNP
jgi:hypothetical protein